MAAPVIAAQPAPSKATRVPLEIKQQIVLRYPSCRNAKEREQLALELGILDDQGKPSIKRLYNLASRLRITGDSEPPPIDEQQLTRHDPASYRFEETQDEKIRNWFGREPPTVIALQIGTSEPAVLYRARQLGLRTFARTYSLPKVALWTGISETALRDLRELHVRRTFDRRHQFKDELISALSLARWLAKPETRDQLSQPDGFFLLEIEEMVEQARANGRARFESCEFLSAGHICQCPYALSYGLYCTNSERYAAGEDPNCPMRTFRLDDLSEPPRPPMS